MGDAMRGARAKSNFWNPMAVYRKAKWKRKGGRRKKDEKTKRRKTDAHPDGRWTILIFIGGIPRIFGSEKTDRKMRTFRSP